MLPKKNRLNRQEIEKLKRERKRVVQGRFFGLVYQPTESLGKFGLIIPNKIVAKATKRNSIKRLLYRAVKEVLFENKGNFLFLAKKGCEQGNLEDFKREMEDFKKMSVTIGNGS